MDAVEDLVLQHQDYVRSLARAIAKKLPKQVEFEELVAMGQLGLTSAAKQYVPGRGVAFTTFSYYRIRGAIFDGLRQMTWLPPSMRRKLARLDGENEVSELTAESAEVSDDPEFLAKQFQTAVGRLGAVFLASGVSKEESDQDDPTDGRSAADEAESREDLGHLREALTKLPEEQSSLIRMLYFEYKSMTEVANELKKNKSTISRRHAEAMDALRAALAA